MSSGPTIDRENSRQDWQTPRDFLAAVKGLLGISAWGCDLAADAQNTVSTNYFSIERSAFTHQWARNNWMWCNPPYSNIRPWVKKAWEESQQGSYIAMLVPASLSTVWWSEWVHRKAHVIGIRPRLTFVGAADPYPKDLALLLYKPWEGAAAFPLGPDYVTWEWRP